MATTGHKPRSELDWIKSLPEYGVSRSMGSKSFLLGRYQAAFLLPQATQKTLGNDGWVFSSAKRLGSDAIAFLVEILGLTLTEQYLGMERYIGNNMQATVFRDNDGKIEHIHFQLYDDFEKVLTHSFASSNLTGRYELFLPA